MVSGQIRPPKENERYFALLRVEAINYQDPNVPCRNVFFDDLTPLHPDKRIVMEAFPNDLNTRVTDMIVPVGFGQRGLIVSPPRAGKTILMQKMAQAALHNYPDIYVFMLLIDERPEEVTDMERQVKGKNCEVISSTFDEAAARHIQVSEMVIEKAKRMVEYGRDVMIFLDSITRLARAGIPSAPIRGRFSPAGWTPMRLQRPKRFFGSARKVEEGGSLTIIATALVDTGSKMDEVIFEEFKGTGNLEIVLDRRLVDKRIWPAIDINRSGTRREEMLMDPEEHRLVCVLRRVLNELNPPEAMDLLTNRLTKTKTNAEFLMSTEYEVSRCHIRMKEMCRPRLPHKAVSPWLWPASIPRLPRGFLAGAVETLTARGVSGDCIEVAWVPGAFEIPMVAERMAASGRYVAVICLGAVIRGETTHDQHINRALSMALAEMGVRHGIPVLFGVLTCNTLEQAIARSGGEIGTKGKDRPDSRLGNKGSECAEAALEMVDLMTKLPKVNFHSLDPPYLTRLAHAK